MNLCINYCKKKLLGSRVSAALACMYNLKYFPPTAMMLVLRTAQYKAHIEKYVVKYTFYSLFQK